MEAEALRAGAQNGGAQNVGRHQVGRGLNALEAETEQTAQRFHHQRLGRARHAFQQRMALAEYGDQNFLDHLALPGDHAAHLFAGVGDKLAGRAQPLRTFSVLVEFLLIFLAHKALSFGLDWMSFDAVTTLPVCLPGRAACLSF